MTAREWSANVRTRNSMSAINWRVSLGSGTSARDVGEFVVVRLTRADGGAYYALELDQAEDFAGALLALVGEARRAVPRD